MPAINRFSSTGRAPGTPASEAFAITPSDATDLALVTTAIYVGGAGNVTLRPVDSTADVTYYSVPAGAYLTIRASRVMATGTTATNLIGEV